MTKHTDEFLKFTDPVTCCEYTLTSDNKDKSHSWVRISNGANELVTDLSNNEQETSEMQVEDFALKTNVLAFASRWKAKATTTKTYSCQLQLPREEDGAIEFWRLKDDLRWRMEEKNARRRRKQEKISILYWSIRTRNSLAPSSSRSFRTQSHWSFSTGKCINSERFLRVHLSHRMCNQFTLHHEFTTDTRRTNFEQKTDGILHVCGSNEQGTYRSQCNWLGSTASCLVQAESVEEASKTLCIGSTPNLLNETDWSSIKHDRTQSSSTLPANCIPKVVVMNS